MGKIHIASAALFFSLSFPETHFSQDKHLEYADSVSAANKPATKSTSRTTPNRINPEGYMAYINECIDMDCITDMAKERLLYRYQSGKIKKFKESIFHIGNYEDYITRIAEEMQIPVKYAIGIAALENGGGDDKASKCCRGIMAIDRNVARKFGALAYRPRANKGGKTSTIDQRGNPKKNIYAGLRYLSELRDMLGGYELAVQAYHCGPERLKTAMRIYLRSKGIAVPKDPNYADLSSQYELSWLSLAKNRRVQEYIRRTPDHTINYVPKVLACNEIYHSRHEIFKQKQAL